MFLISKTIPELMTALKQGFPIYAKAGKWRIEHPWIFWLRRLFNLEIYPLLYLAQYLIHLLKIHEQESAPLLSQQHACSLVQERLFLDFGYLLLKHTACHAKAIHIEQKLRRYLIALEYRIEQTLPLKKNPSNLLVEIKKNAQNWKKEQLFFGEKFLLASELKKLKEASLYHKFAELLVQDFRLQEQFFNWCLKDRNQVAVFVEFPFLQEKLVFSQLSSRIGKISEGALLKVKKVWQQGIVKKVVTLPFEGKEISILDPQHSIHFSEGYSLQIWEIFKVFERKNVKAGNLEFFAHGIVNWNTLKLGRWNPKERRHSLVNLLIAKWWEQLPCLEVIDRKEAKRRYGKHFSRKLWIAAAAASRGSPTLNFEETHAYLEIAIPIHKHHYAIYDFGKVATFFPSNTLEMLKIFCINLYAAISYPDDNVFYSHRQQTRHAFALQPKQGKMIMERIKRDIFLSRQRNFIYQIESENCAKWVYEIIAEILGKRQIPNLFKMKLLHTEPVGIIAHLFGLIKKFPDGLQTPVITALHLPLGAWIGTAVIENGRKIKKAVIHHAFWQTAEIYLPALLLDLKEKGALFQDLAAEKLGKLNFCYRELFFKNYKPMHKVLPPLIFINLTDKSIILTR